MSDGEIPVEIFTAPRCGYCDKAKALLREKGLSYREHDVSAADARAELAARLPRVKAVPQIFLAGTHIGGYEDLCLLNQRGLLDSPAGSGD